LQSFSRNLVCQQESCCLGKILGANTTFKLFISTHTKEGARIWKYFVSDLCVALRYTHARTLYYLKKWSTWWPISFRKKESAQRDGYEIMKIFYWALWITEVRHLWQSLESAGDIKSKLYNTLTKLGCARTQAWVPNHLLNNIMLLNSLNYSKLEYGV